MNGFGLGIVTEKDISSVPSWQSVEFEISTLLCFAELTHPGLLSVSLAQSHDR